jgi:hypothetical protein
MDAGIGCQLTARRSIRGGRLWSDHAHLFEELLQREGDLLFAGKCAAVPEDLGADGREAIKRHADPAARDFFRQLFDREADLQCGVMGAWLEEMRWNTGQNITEPKNDLLLLFARFWIGFRIARGGHAAATLAKTVKRATI